MSTILVNTLTGKTSAGDVTITAGSKHNSTATFGDLA